MVYDMSGQLVAEFYGSTGALRREYVYGSGWLVATIEPSGGKRYTTTDHLGSPRVVTDAAGAVVSRHDYMPFGDELPVGSSGRSSSQGYGIADGLRRKFATYERDAEAGLDYAKARYYAYTQARFTSPDPFHIVMERQSKRDEEQEAAFKEYLSNPQRWNRYAYVLNNPPLLNDPTGLDMMIIENGPVPGNPAGHTAIALTGRGVFSMGNGGGDGNASRNIMGER
ncbi:MAG TPA: RHS repeat-associated core domain-containing protein [Pyrinomonadaceae bacterium]|nr:RHS repeat-associated core domain-containing protein [Pyrinomonadaceae bacterium]